MAASANWTKLLPAVAGDSVLDSVDQPATDTAKARAVELRLWLY
jgi:hypothetical protein